MTQTQFQLPRLKPRNPYAMAARLRRAGEHRRSAGSQRQANGRHLRDVLADIHPPPTR